MTASLAHLDPPILLQLTHEMPNRNRHKKQDTPERVCRVCGGRHPSFKKMKKVTAIFFAQANSFAASTQKRQASQMSMESDLGSPTASRSS